MKTSSLKLLCLTTLLLVFGLSGRLWAQKIVQVESPNFPIESQEAGARRNGVIIFSNLGPSKTDRYNTLSYAAFPVAAKNASPGPETWVAINFTPNKNAQARVLLAAINYLSGTKLVNLGLYTDADGKVGSPIAGAQGSTTDIPDNGDCCRLTKVTLAGSGVSLTAGTRYWLVASPDDVHGATFSGKWQVSNIGAWAETSPSGGSVTAFGTWPAAEIRGALAEDAVPHEKTPANSTNSKTIGIFSNLGPTATDVFSGFAVAEISGQDAADGSEVWAALPFTAKVNCYATRLAAAIQHVSGDMKVNLSLYSDNAGTVGTLLPNGQAGTTSIPEYPSCCSLTEVRLPGSGVTLAANTQYWLVASTDDVHDPSFEGFWFAANVFSNYQEPQFFFWTYRSSDWLAAEITGTNP